MGQIFVVVPKVGFFNSVLWGDLSPKSGSRKFHSAYLPLHVWQLLHLVIEKEHFNSLPLELWFNCVLYLLPECTARSITELALEANIQNETLTAAYTAEEFRHAKFVSIARERYARNIPTH